MAFLRRRPADPASERTRASFRACATRVDAAQRALIAAIPTARHPGVPLGVALAEFERLLKEAGEAMGGWREERTMHEWTMCRGALEDARTLAGRLSSQRDPLGFEALNARVGDVLHPLEAFADAAAALRRF